VDDGSLAEDAPEGAGGLAAGVWDEPEVGEVCANAFEARSALEVRRISDKVCDFFIS